MRKFLLYVLCSFLLAGLLAGCAAFKTEFRDEYGRALDHPYGDQPVITTITFHQRYDGWVSIAVDGKFKKTVPYGSDYSVNIRSRKLITYEVWWEEMIGYNSVLQPKRHHITGLYTGQPIVIDEHFLRDTVWLDIVVKNQNPHRLELNAQGRHFFLDPMEFIILKIGSGLFQLDWKSADGTGAVMCGEKMELPGHKVLWNGQYVDDVIKIHRSEPTATEDRIFLRGECLRL